MRHKEIIYLIAENPELLFIQPEFPAQEGDGLDEIGNSKLVETERMVYANEFSVSMNEYYAAAAVGLKPVKTFEIYSFEYRGEGIIKHNECKYHIARADARGEKTRLICERMAANG